MTRASIQRLALGALSPALVAAVALPAVGMQEEDDRHTTKIHIESHGEPDGERHVAKHEVVFVDEDGETIEIEGEGGGFAWHAGEEGRHYRMRPPRFGPGERVFLGVSTTRMTTELREHFGAPADAGVMVSKVVDDSGAFTAGLLVGDIITAVDGEPIASPRDLFHVIRQHEEGETVSLEIYRDGKVQSLQAVLGKIDRPEWAMKGLPHHFAHFPHHMKIDCEEDGGDCDIILSRRLELCPGEQDCDIDISCDSGDCSCSVNGEPTDCGELGGVHERPED